MKYISEFRDQHLAENIIAKLKHATKPDHHYKFMEFCGGHTHAIYRYGLPELLPDNIELIHGPGCPVCVLPVRRLLQAIELAKMPDVIFCSYGDMLRVPAARGVSLLSAKAQGADVRMVYAVDDALDIARQNPDKRVVFFAIGFETTTPPTAVAIKRAAAEGITNFLVFCNHVLTEPALVAMLNGRQALNVDTATDNNVPLQGFIGPAHVSVIIGSDAYRSVSEKYHKSFVISGFEPLDMLQSILMLVQQVNEGRVAVENQYTRAVSPAGNVKAQQLMQEVFEVRDSFEWRGFGEIPNSALVIRPEFAQFDAAAQLAVPEPAAELVKQPTACACGQILQGLAKPQDCPLFGKVCTPENPMGACMVSSEGACAASYNYGAE